MAVKINAEKCIGCGNCTLICPQDALSINGVVEVDPELCIECGLCVEICEHGILSLEE